MMRFFPFIILCWVQSLSAQELSLETTWRYLPADRPESLHVDRIPDFANAIQLNLPHRILLPDQSLWYGSRCNFMTSGYLKINADDGAQLWIGNKRVRAEWDNYFAVSSDSLPVDLAIRVLNNAMKGGLHSVHWMSKEDFDSLKHKRDSLLEAFRNFPKSLPVALRESDRNFSFSFWGDSQGGWTTFRKHISRMAEFKDPLTIGLGDLVGNGSDPGEWLQFLMSLQGLPPETRVLAIPGNHDYDGFYDALVPEFYHECTNALNRGRTYFTFYAGGCAFLALDPNRNFPIGFDDLQLQFADSVFHTQSWQNAQWRFVLAHQPPYGQGWEGYSGESFFKNWIESNAVEHKIDLVLSGHIHDYERLSLKDRGHQTTFIVSGGAGGHLEPPPSNPTPKMDKVLKTHHFGRVEVHRKKLICTIYESEPELKIIDRFILEK